MEEGYYSMKIKILKSSNIKNLENQVNAFIKGKCIISITNNSTVSNICDGQETILIFVILYDEYNNLGYLDSKSIMDFKNSRLK